MMLHDGPDLLAPRSFFSVSGVGLFRSRGSFFVRSRGSVFVRSRGSFLFGLGGRFFSVSGVVFFSVSGFGFFLTWESGLEAENGVRKCDIFWASPIKVIVC